MSVRGDYASGVLLQFITSGKQPPAGPPPAKPQFTQSEREQNAQKQRTELHAVLDKGEQPTGYRAEWIRECSGLVMELLSEAADQFCVEHPDDCATSGDLLDILATVKNSVNK